MSSSPPRTSFTFVQSVATQLLFFIMPEWISSFPGYSQLVRRLKKILGGIICTGPIPRHVGVIMDGNRRYARTHKIELKEGHNLGFDTMASILELLYESGVECATVYAFSIENFKRLKYEVEWLMDLAKSKLRQISQHGDLCDQYGIRIRILGNTLLLPSDVRKILRETEEMTKHNTKAVLNVCFPYTLRDEIAHSVKSVVEEASQDASVVIDESTIDRHLYTADSSPVDILIRTSGTYRLLDFLLWQLVPSTCAIVFSDKMWPEFSTWDMTRILLNWSFNTYWYGAGSGQTMEKVGRTEVKRVEGSIERIQSSEPGSLTAYERYAIDSDSDSRSDKADTVTSVSLPEKEREK